MFDQGRSAAIHRTQRGQVRSGDVEARAQMLPQQRRDDQSLNARQKTASTSGSARSSYHMLLHEKREDPVMNLAWIATLSVFVLAEKIIPRGFWVAKAAGLVLVAWGRPNSRVTSRHFAC